MDVAELRRLWSVNKPLGEWNWGGDVYVMGICAATIAMLFLPGNHGGNTALVAATLAGIVACLLAGRPVLRSKELTWRAWVLVGVMAALALVALAFSPLMVTTAPLPVAVASVPAVYPIIFIALPIWAAQAVSGVVTAMPMMIVLIAGRPVSAEYLPLAVFATVLGVIAALVVGSAGATLVQQREELAVALSELAASRAESARLSSEAGAATERERMAREIHDTLAQGFTSIVALSQAVEAERVSDPAAADRHLELIETTARENLSEARVIVAGLTPAALGEGSLVAAIRRLCNKLVAETGISVSMSVEKNLRPLAMAADVVLLRTAQEGLANIRKHAHATAVLVELSAAAMGVRLLLADNGVGLGLEHSDGFGLTGMRARVTQVGGTMAVSRTPGGGVTLEIQVPT